MPFTQSPAQRNCQLIEAIKKGCALPKKKQPNNSWVTPIGYSPPILDPPVDPAYVNPVTGGNCCQLLIVFSNNFQICSSDQQINDQDYYIYGYQLLKQEQQNNV